MKEIVERLQENRNIERAKQIMESAGYKVSSNPKRLKESKKMNESSNREILYQLNKGGMAAEDIESCISHYQPNAKGIDDLDDDTVDRILGYLHRMYSYRIEKYGEDAEIPFEAFELLGLIKESKRLKEDHETPDSLERKAREESRGGEAPEEGPFWTISIDAGTNAPGTKYYGGERYGVGKRILQSANISESEVSVTILGYDDISFVVKSDDKKYVDRIARKIAAYAEEPGDHYREAYDMPEDAVVSIAGPYSNEDFDYEDDTDLWYR